MREDYSSAQQKLEVNDHDCIILDIGLPGGSGLNLLSALKADRKDDGVLIISAKNAVSDIVHGLRMGADDCRTKPFHLSELSARLDVPRLSNTLIHPTLFYYPTEKSSVSLGWSVSFEKRTGGAFCLRCYYTEQWPDARDQYRSEERSWDGKPHKIALSGRLYVACSGGHRLYAQYFWSEEAEQLCIPTFQNGVHSVAGVMNF